MQKKMYKNINFVYPLNRLKINWNFKNRFDVYTIDNVGYESYLESINYIFDGTIKIAEMVANKIANYEDIGYKTYRY